jgi:hypothetical protein
MGSVPLVLRFGELETIVSSATSRAELFAESGFRTKLFSRLDALLPKGGLLSLDVFDTLILRDNSSELTRFREIGDRMADIFNNTSESERFVRGVDAFLARHMGTKASYRASPPVDNCREGSLTEIHVTASRILCGSDALARNFIEAELNYEAERLTINALLIDYACRFRKLGGRVILVSDTYILAEQIQELFERIGLKHSLFDRLFSSADTKVSKASGGLFELVEREMDAGSADFLHVGDSLRGDFKNPKARGWRAFHLPIPDAEIAERRRDHLATLAQLQDSYGFTADVVVPS